MSKQYSHPAYCCYCLGACSSWRCAYDHNAPHGVCKEHQAALDRGEILPEPVKRVPHNPTWPNLPEGHWINSKSAYGKISEKDA